MPGRRSAVSAAESAVLALRAPLAEIALPASLESRALSESQKAALARAPAFAVEEAAR
jgi:hypothetical protein